MGKFTALLVKYRRRRVSGGINFTSERAMIFSLTLIAVVSSLHDRGALQPNLQIRICLRNDGAEKGLNQSHRQVKNVDLRLSLVGVERCPRCSYDEGTRLHHLRTGPLAPRTCFAFTDKYIYDARICLGVELQHYPS